MAGLRQTSLWLVSIIIGTSTCYSSVISPDVAVRSSTTFSTYLAAVSNNSLSRSIKKSKPPPFAPPRQCSLTENELNQMNELLQSFDDNAKIDNLTCNDKKNYESMVVVSLTNDRCSQLKGSITNNVNDLKIIFQCLKNTGDNDDRYEEFKMTYEEKIRELQKRVATVEKKFEQKFKKIINNLKRRFHQLEKEMRETLEELGRERLGRQEDNTKLILEYLENGKITSAWTTFKDKLMGNSKTNIDKIVKSAIGKELGTNITTENLVKFTQGLTDDPTAMAHGAIQVFKVLEYRQALCMETVRILYVAIGQIIMTCKALEGTHFETLKFILDENTIDQVIHVQNKLEFLIEYVHQQKI